MKKLSPEMTAWILTALLIVPAAYLFSVVLPACAYKQTPRRMSDQEYTVYLEQRLKSIEKGITVARAQGSPRPETPQDQTNRWRNSN